MQEIRSYEAPTRIANAPSFIKGVVNLRGVIVPIVDLRIKLGCESAGYDAFTVVIVLNVKGRVVGAVVDSVSDVLELAAARSSRRPSCVGDRQQLHHRHRQRSRAHADPDRHRVADGEPRDGPRLRRRLKPPRVTREGVPPLLQRGEEARRPDTWRACRRIAIDRRKPCAPAVALFRGTSQGVDDRLAQHLTQAPPAGTEREQRHPPHRPGGHPGGGFQLNSNT